MIIAIGENGLLRCFFLAWQVKSENTMRIKKRAKEGEEEGKG
jgi:hypothetical protein